MIVSSGDGGWVHLGPHIADVLAAHGFFVVGFDVKGYLAGFTSASGPLRPEDVPGDYRVLLDFAAGGVSVRPVLVGVSEGAGLSVLAAADPRVHAAAAGVVGVGLPAGQRARVALARLADLRDPRRAERADVQRRVVRRPGGAAAARRDPLDSRRVRQRSDDTARIVAAAAEPKRLWTIDAADHGFSDNLGEFDARLLEALDWVHERAAH